MKKLFSALSLVCLLVFSNLNANALSIMLYFGAPPDCKGFGICKAEGIILKAVPNNAAQADLTVTSDGHLKFVFNQQSMSRETYVKYFGSNKFIVDADYITPVDVMQLFGLSSPYTIKRGVYPVVKNTTNNTYEIVL